MAVSRLDGFCRYAFAVQYHGAPFLGFSYQQNQEDCILEDGTDWRGVFSVEGRIRKALCQLVGPDNYENIQVSSRTDRGVHALRNTCHVDIRPRKPQHDEWESCNLHHGLNYHLSRHVGRRDSRGNDPWYLGQQNDTIRILSVAKAPHFMKNRFYGQDSNQPETIDWNARFSATQRTYVYRILNLINGERDDAVPFEWDRSWRINTNDPLNISAMKQAASYLIGMNDFTTFRSSKCQRLSPIVTIQDVQISNQPYDVGMFAHKPSDACLVNICITGDAFLYRQVRNMVGLLVTVGSNKLDADAVAELLEKRDRTKAPAMAPARGLFLTNVKHGDFIF